jgi:hypothetical protein
MFKYSGKKKSLLALAVGALGIVGLVASFQNCGGQFHANPDAFLSLASISGALTISPKDTPQFITGQELAFEATGTGIAPGAAFQWGFTSSNSDCHGHQELSAPSIFSVHCETAAQVKVVVNVINPDGKSAQLTKDFTVSYVAPTPTPVPGTASVAFAIKAGTASNSYNTQAQEIEFYVGQTLRITNNDSIDHQLHVDRFNPVADMNARPCAHAPNAIKPGGTYDCVATKAYDPALHPIIWDHLAGTSARFYLRVIDGAACFTKNCVSCHTAASRKNSTVAQIQTALAQVPEMKNIVLTPAQVRALAYQLSR